MGVDYSKPRPVRNDGWVKDAMLAVSWLCSGVLLVLMFNTGPAAYRDGYAEGHRRALGGLLQATAPDPCHTPGMVAWECVEGAEQVKLCPYEDGSPDGLPCWWINYVDERNELYYIDSSEYRR